MAFVRIFVITIAVIGTQIPSQIHRVQVSRLVCMHMPASISSIRKIYLNQTKSSICLLRLLEFEHIQNDLPSDLPVLYESGCR